MIYESAQDRAMEYNKNYAKNESPFRIALVYTYAEDGSPLLRFLGETACSNKIYKHLSSYKPRGGDYVLLAKVSNTYVILGKVGEAWKI